jgi:hypothetical protein
VGDLFGFVETTVQNDDYFHLVRIARCGKPDRFQALADEAFFVSSRDNDGKPGLHV